MLIDHEKPLGYHESWVMKLIEESTNMWIWTPENDFLLIKSW